MNEVNKLLKIKMIEIGGTENAESRSRKGLVISYTVFLLFSALLFLVAELSIINLRSAEHTYELMAIDRARDQFDAIEFSLTRFAYDRPDKINYTAFGGGAEMSMSERLPLQGNITNDSNIFASFVESFSGLSGGLNSSVDIIGNGTPGLHILSQGVTVIHPNPYSVEFNPDTNVSGSKITGYNLSIMVFCVIHPSFKWNEVNKLKEGDNDTLNIHAQAVSDAYPDDIKSITDYNIINKSKYNSILISEGPTDAVYIDIYGNETPGRMVIRVNNTCSIIMNATITFDSNITSLTQGPVPANISVSVGDVFTKTSVIR